MENYDIKIFSWFTEEELWNRIKNKNNVTYFTFINVNKNCENQHLIVYGTRNGLKPHKNKTRSCISSVGW